MEQIDADDLPKRYLPDVAKHRNSCKQECSMRVVIYAQDLSGRQDDGHYTKPDISSALDIFFDPNTTEIFSDSDGENHLSRNEAEGIFRLNKKLVFYNADGEKIIISYDPSS
jgi:hypothetical protein